MGYHLDFTALGLDFLKRRLESVEPIPSQLPLLENLGVTMAALGKAGIRSLEEASKALKGPAGPARTAELTGLDQKLLVILRRMIEGLRPKPQALSEFPGVDPSAIRTLAAAGIKDSRRLYLAAAAKGARSDLAKKAGIPMAVLTELVSLSDLCRIQWVGATYARLLYAAGYLGPAAIAAADPEVLQRKVAAANLRLSLSKTEIGLKDSARLVALAAFLEDGMEG